MIEKEVTTHEKIKKLLINDTKIDVDSDHHQFLVKDRDDILFIKEQIEMLIEKLKEVRGKWGVVERRALDESIECLKNELALHDPAVSETDKISMINYISKSIVDSEAKQ